MTKLKTLKDLNLSPFDRGDYVAKKRLRQEAIKWIKEDIRECDVGYWEDEIPNLTSKWMERLNITKEDVE
jgi:hypothetical protein